MGSMDDGRYAKAVSKRSKRIEQYFLNKDDMSDPETDNFWRSIQQVLKQIDAIAALESSTDHPQLGYSGTFDGVVRFCGKWVLVDWKTSSTHRGSIKGCYNYPTQLVAYMGALNADPLYPFQVEEALLVIAYEDGSPASVFRLDKPTCEEQWESMWLGCLANYCDYSAKQSFFHRKRLPLVWHRPRNFRVWLSGRSPETGQLVSSCAKEWELYEQRSVS